MGKNRARLKSSFQPRKEGSVPRKARKNSFGAYSMQSAPNWISRVSSRSAEKRESTAREKRGFSRRAANSFRLVLGLYASAYISRAGSSSPSPSALRGTPRPFRRGSA